MLWKRQGNLLEAQRQLELALSLHGEASAEAGVIKMAIERLSMNEHEQEEVL